MVEECHLLVGLSFQLSSHLSFGLPVVFLSELSVGLSLGLSVGLLSQLSLHLSFGLSFQLSFGLSFGSSIIGSTGFCSGFPSFFLLKVLENHGNPSTNHFAPPFTASRHGSPGTTVEISKNA
jgi:hypothetical protein